MKTKKLEYAERFTVGVNADMAKAIQKSGESAGDWFRQAARNRLESERNGGNPHAAGDGRIDRSEPEIAQLRKEIAKLQQSETIVQAALLDMRRTLTAVQQNQVELRRSLEQMNAGFGHAFSALGQSLMVALSQQLRELVKAHEEPPKRPLPPILPRTRL